MAAAGRRSGNRAPHQRNLFGILVPWQRDRPRPTTRQPRRTRLRSLTHPPMARRPLPAVVHGAQEATAAREARADGGAALARRPTKTGRRAKLVHAAQGGRSGHFQRGRSKRRSPYPRRYARRTTATTGTVSRSLLLVI